MGTCATNPNMIKKTSHTSRTMETKASDESPKVLEDNSDHYCIKISEPVKSPKVVEHRAWDAKNHRFSNFRGDWLPVMDYLTVKKIPPQHSPFMRGNY